MSLLKKIFGAHSKNPPHAPDIIFIRMCWKCDNCITRNISTKAKEMIGCKLNPEIKGFEDAQRLCPIKEKK